MLACLTSQQHASVSQGRICSDNLTCCHTEIEVADQTFHLTQSQYTDTGPTSPSADPITPGAWQGSHWSANFLSHWYDSTPKKIPSQAGFEPGIFRPRGGRFTTRPTRLFYGGEVITSQKVSLVFDPPPPPIPTPLPTPYPRRPRTVARERRRRRRESKTETNPQPRQRAD